MVKTHFETFEIPFQRGLTEGTVTGYGLIVPKSKREEKPDRRKPAVPRTNIIPSG
jgi:hypothetical protein